MNPSHLLQGVELDMSCAVVVFAVVYSCEAGGSRHANPELDKSYFKRKAVERCSFVKQGGHPS